MSKWLFHTALMAGSYFLAGCLGQMLAVPPSYATAIWPASGIALAGLLLAGYRMVPGLYLGALLANGWTPVFTADDLNWQIFILPASISFGATAQAVLGTYLIRRFVGFPNPLTQDRLVVAFLTLGGPLACVLGASWGVASLVSMEVLEPSQVGLNWWTWWVGDVIGVIIFTPLLLICFAQPREVWKPRLLSVGLPLSAAFVFTLAAYVTLQVIDQSKEELRFERLATGARSHLQEHLDEQVEALQSVESFFTSSQQVERAEFASFNRHLMSRHPAVQAIAWLPLVSDTEREDHEAQAQAGGVPDYRLRELSEDNSLTRCTNREEYFPVFYLQHKQTTTISIGRDIASTPQEREALLRCRDSGRPTATRPCPLSKQGHGDTTFLIFVPVYASNPPPATVDLRRQALRGFILGEVRTKDLIRTALPKKLSKRFRLTIIDQSPMSNDITAYSQESVVSPHKASEVADTFSRPIQSISSINAVDRKWKSQLSPTFAFHAWKANRYTWPLLASVLALTALLGTFLLVLSGRTARIEASESRYLDLYHNAPDMFVSVDVATRRVLECNKTFLEATNYTEADVVGKHIDDLFAPDSQAEAQRAFRLFLTHGEARDIELQLPCSDGSLIDISMNVSAVRDEQDESIYCRSVLRDITAKKQVEARMKKQEMELAHVARLSMMGEMAAGLAHEINQPLAAIAAYAEGTAIRLRDGSVDTPELTEVVDRISSDAHRAGEVIRRLRKFVKKRESDKRDVDVNELVREVAEFVTPDLKHHEIQIRLDLVPSLPKVCGDAIQIQQVLLNLVRNGCDAMAETDLARRILTIMTRAEDHKTIQVTVEDSGFGLADTLDEQVFEAFYSSKIEGLGMGLAISRSIIETHGGRIWATTNTREGASFHFTLPASSKISRQQLQSENIPG